MSIQAIRSCALSVVTAAALGAMSFVGPVNAAEAKSVAVSYADLDLTSDAGRAMLERRIDRATEAACEGAKANTGTQIQNKYRTCLAEARANVAKKVQLAITSARVDSVAEAK
ncbi:MAG: UrcA family protein [Alphaproteobacteria bacterium]|nr:UrcA family protein [Alphaproteobacteria bacterium]